MNADIMRRSRGEGGGERGGKNSLKNHKSIGLQSNTGPDSLKIHKAAKPAFNAGPSSARSETPFKWRFAGGPMMARFLWYLDRRLSHHQLRRRKNVFKVRPSLTKLSGSAHAFVKSGFRATRPNETTCE